MKQEDTKQRILEKSLELFASKGYDAVSVGEIAKAVGVKAPSLYNHFASKQAIFDAIVESTAAHYEKTQVKFPSMCRMSNRTLHCSPIFQRMRWLKRFIRFSFTPCTIIPSANFAR